MTKEESASKSADAVAKGDFWHSTWQPNSHGEHWTQEKVIIRWAGKNIELDSVENNLGYEWYGAGTVIADEFIAGDWESKKPGANSRGTFILHCGNQGEHLLGFFLGRNKDGSKPNYGAWAMVKHAPAAAEPPAQRLERAKERLGGLCPGLHDLPWASSHDESTWRRQLEERANLVDLPEGTVLLLKEALQCLGNKHYRSAVVSSWAGAIHLLHLQVVKSCLSEFNNEAMREINRWRRAKTADELASLGDAKFLEIAERLTVIAPAVRDALNVCRERRNQCGHPNSLQLGEKSVQSHFDILWQNVVLKFPKA